MGIFKCCAPGCENKMFKEFPEKDSAGKEIKFCCHFHRQYLYFLESDADGRMFGHNCKNCKYEDIIRGADPCSFCIDFSNWFKKE